MKRQLAFALMLCLPLLAMRCKDNGTQPIDDTAPGKRDYVWTTDTLSYPGSMQTTMYSIWASSPTDVHVVGHNELNRGQMFHFDGQKWSPVRLAVSDGGNILGAFDLTGVYGCGPNDVYAVGEKIYQNPTPPPNFLDSSLIIHFDGTAWRELPLPRRTGILFSVWGSSNNDVWISGQHGVLAHNDGFHWSFFQFDTTLAMGSLTGTGRSNVFAVGGRYNPPRYDSTMYFLYHFDGTSWTKADSFLICPTQLQWKFGTSTWMSTNERLYTACYGVYVRVGTGWSTLLSNDWPLKVGGSSDKNIFAAGDLGRVFHWNGTDWKRLNNIENSNWILWAVWTNNTETFIVGNDGGKSCILHGK